MSNKFNGHHPRPFGRGRGAFAGSASRQQQQQQPRQEDAQPNLGEGWNLRPQTYKIGRREPDPAPPHVASSSAHVPHRPGPSASAIKQDIDWTKVPTGPSGMQSNKNMSWKRDTSTQATGQQQPGGLTSNATDGSKPVGGQRVAAAGNASTITLPTPEQIDSLKAQNFASSSSAVSSNAPLRSTSTSNGAIRVSEDGDVWRSPTGRAESGTPGLSSAAMLLASVSRVDSSTSDTEWSNNTGKRNSRDTPVASTSRLGSVAGQSTVQQQPAVRQDRVQTPLAGTGADHSMVRDTADSSTPKAPPLFRTPSLEEIKREAPSSRSAFKDKGKGRADPQQWEVISITDDSDMETDEVPPTNRPHSRLGPQDMEIDNVEKGTETRPPQTGRTQSSNQEVPKRDHRTHIFHFSQALINFIETHPSVADNLRSYEIRREQERLSAAGFESSVDEGKNQDRVQIQSWRRKDKAPLPSIGEKDASDRQHHFTHLSGAPSRYQYQHMGKTSIQPYAQASEFAKYLSRDGSTVHYAVVDPAYTVFEVIQPASTSNTTSQQASVTKSQPASIEPKLSVKSQPNSSTPQSVPKARPDLVRKYIYHFSLALAQHDCGKSNYVHLLKEYELDFEKDRASSEGYQLDIGSIGDTVKITAKPKSNAVNKPISIDSHDKENNIWHHYYPRKAGAQYIRKEYATRAERQERLARSSSFLEGLRKDWYEVETAVLGPSYTVVEVSRPRMTAPSRDSATTAVVSSIGKTATADNRGQYLLRPSPEMLNCIHTTVELPKEGMDAIWDYELKRELDDQAKAGIDCQPIRRGGMECEIVCNPMPETREPITRVRSKRPGAPLPSNFVSLPPHAQYVFKTWPKVLDSKGQAARARDHLNVLLSIKKLGDRGEVVAVNGTWAIILVYRLQEQSSLNKATHAAVVQDSHTTTKASASQASSTDARASSLPILQSLTSVFDLPVKLRRADGKAATARQRTDRANFVQTKYEELERSLGIPVTPVHEGEIFTSSTVRLIYDAPTLQADRFLVPLPEGCLYSHEAAKVVQKNRDDFKFKQGIIQAQQGKVAKEAFYSHSFLVMVLETSASVADKTTSHMEIDVPASSLSGQDHSAAPIAIKREAHSPAAPKTPNARPATPVSPVAQRHPVCFPLDIKTSYADSAHTKTNVEAFIKNFIEHYERSRSRLIDFYTQSATFGYTVNDGSGVRRKEDTISAFGDYSIINTMRRLPACTHRTSDGKLVYDALRIGAPAKGPMAYCDILVTLHGEFAEFESGNKRSFDRTFYLSPINNPARLPYLIMSDSILVRAWSSSDAWRPSSLPQQREGIASHVKMPAKPVTPQKTIALPKPKITSAAFVRAVSELPQNMADYDTREQRPPVASGSSSTSRSELAAPARVTGKRPQRIVEINDSDDELDMLGTGGRLSSEGRRVKARTDSQAGTPDPVAVSKLEERVKTLELRLNASAKGSPAETVLSKKQKKKANKAARVEETSSPKKKAGPLTARDSFIALQSTHTDHTMWGGRSRSKARMFFYAPETSGYLGVSMGGDVELWRPDRLVRTSEQLASMPSNLHKDLSVDAAIFSETHQAVIVGYKLGLATATGTSEPLPQACILRLNNHGRTGEPSAPLRREILEHRPHVKNQITAMTLLSHPSKEKFATAGNDGVICIWDIPEPGARIASPRQIRTNHSSAVRALVHLHGQGKRLLSAGMDSRVNIVDFGKSTEIQTWRESTAIQRAYAHPVNPNLAMLCLSSIDDQFRLVDLRQAPTARQPLVFGARTPKETALGQYLQGQFNGDLFAYAFDDAVRIWDIRNVSKPFIVKTGISDIIQPYFESSTRMTFLEKHHFSTLSYQYAAGES